MHRARAARSSSVRAAAASSSWLYFPFGPVRGVGGGGWLAEGKISILFFHSFFSFREKGLSDSRPVCPAGSLSLVPKFYRFFLVVSCELLVSVVKIFERNEPVKIFPRSGKMVRWIGGKIASERTVASSKVEPKKKVW